MGRYFPQARSVKNLSPTQLAQYEKLRQLSTQDTPMALAERIRTIERYISPLTSEEIRVAAEELLEDAFASWVLADETPAKVQWVALKAGEPLPSPDEDRQEPEELHERLPRKSGLPQKKTLLERLGSIFQREMRGER